MFNDTRAFLQESCSTTDFFQLEVVAESEAKDSSWKIVTRTKLSLFEFTAKWDKGDVLTVTTLAQFPMRPIILEKAQEMLSYWRHLPERDI